MYASQFVGRQNELKRLSSLEQIARRATPIALIGGAAGMGKSRLIAQYRTATEPARMFAVGACLEYAAGVLAPFRHVLRSLMESAPHAVATQPRLFERLGAYDDDPDRALEVPLREQKLRLFELYSSALHAVALEKPVTVVLEDIQWADSNSLDLIRYLAQTTVKSNLVILATFRNEELGQLQPLRQLVGRLAPMPAVHCVDLAPLPDDDIDLLVQSILGGTAVDKAERNAIRLRAEGNPLFAEELARHVRDGREERTRLPLSIREAVCARLPLLSSEERLILLRAAVIGRSFDASVLAAISGRPLAFVLETLRRARDLAFVVEGPPPCFTFHHALTREAFYSELLEAERRAIHAATLDIFEREADRPVPIAALAYHAWAARETEKGIRYCERAGDEATKARAVTEAAEFYERAIEISLHDVDAARLHHKLGVVRLSGGFPARAISSFSEGLALARRENDTLSIAQCALGIAEAYAYLGEEERGLAFLEAARDARAAESEPLLRACAHLYSARIALADREIKAAFGHLSAVEEFCDSLDNRAATLFYATRADAKLMQRRYDEAVADQEHAVELTVGADDRRYEAEQRAALGSILLLAGRLKLAAAAYYEAFMAAERNFDVGQSALYRAHYAEVQLMLGRTEDAKSIVQELLALAVQTENPAFIVLLGRIGLFVSLRTGDRALGRRIVERLELDERFRDDTPPRMFPISGAYAQWLLDQGRTDEANAVLRRAVDRLSQKRLRSTDWSVCTLLTVAMSGSVEDLATAREVLAMSFSALASAFLSFFDALASLRAQRESEARAFARAAASGLHSFQFCYEAALAWELAGEKQMALDLFTQQGAHRDAQRIQRSMLSINRRGRAENELTTREREIAGAIAAGDTNRMIAERYCITEKTVETHVASIFNRLGIRSRSEVAARLRTLVAVDER